jgi:hypothetical protein
LETFVLFFSVIRKRGFEKPEHFYRALAEREDFGRDPYDRAIAEHVFDDRLDTWAYFPNPSKPGELTRVSIRKIFEQITDNARPVEYEMYCTMGSDEVHSTPMSLAGILGRIRSRDTFILQPILSDDVSVLALAISNSAMLLVLDSFNEYAGLGLDTDLNAIKAMIRSYDESRAGSK